MEELRQLPAESLCELLAYFFDSEEAKGIPENLVEDFKILIGSLIISKIPKGEPEFFFWTDGVKSIFLSSDEDEKFGKFN